MHRVSRTFILLLLVIAPTLRAADEVDRDAIHRIKQEVFKHTEVMDHMFHLVEVYGPRITGSPGFEGAAKWSASRLEDWGAEKVKLERWGPFGQGWSRSYFSAHLVEPQYEMLIGVPLGWTPSTDGVVSGTPIITPFESQSTPKKLNQTIDEFIAEYEGKLSGQIILITDLKDVGVQSDPAMHRLTSADLSKRAEAPILQALQPSDSHETLLYDPNQLILFDF